MSNNLKTYFFAFHTVCLAACTPEQEPLSPEEYEVSDSADPVADSAVQPSTQPEAEPAPAAQGYKPAPMGVRPASGELPRARTPIKVPINREPPSSRQAAFRLPANPTPPPAGPSIATKRAFSDPFTLQPPLPRELPPLQVFAPEGSKSAPVMPSSEPALLRPTPNGDHRKSDFLRGAAGTEARELSADDADAGIS